MVYDPNRPATEADAQRQREQLAKWYVTHALPVPSGPVVDAFVAEMGTKLYGVEETADAWLWFRSGWQAVTRTPAAWRYRYGASGWRYVAKESDCNPGDGYEREPVFVVKTTPA